MIHAVLANIFSTVNCCILLQKRAGCCSVYSLLLCRKVKSCRRCMVCTGSRVHVSNVVLAWAAAHRLNPSCRKSAMVAVLARSSSCSSVISCH